MPMKSSTILWGLGALVLVGGVFALTGGGSGTAKPNNGGKFGPVGGLKGNGAGSSPGPSDGSTTGLTVDKDCGIVITDLGVAQTAAFELGQQFSLKEAKARLYRRGGCGVTEPLKPVRAQLRNNYLVTYQLLRGQVASGQISRALAEVALLDVFFQVAIAKVSTDGLPRTFP